MTNKAVKALKQLLKLADDRVAHCYEQQTAEFSGHDLQRIGHYRARESEAILFRDAARSLLEGLTKPPRSARGKATETVTK
jgi:hypothetical protein